MDILKLNTIDLSTRLYKPTNCSYSPEPRTEVYCFRLNFNTSKFANLDVLYYFFDRPVFLHRNVLYGFEAQISGVNSFSCRKGKSIVVFSVVKLLEGNSLFWVIVLQKKYLLVGASSLFWVYGSVSERCMYFTPIRLDLL